ncbi:GAF domain-containing protein [Jannaschia rubra]|uniref:GAF domain-containing protein n=1 Tax=Jannaschia rubra TaxID=282197 RepID=UPI00249342F4|nr:GAF domain-containing protein [Jannaschia rubra]
MRQEADHIDKVMRAVESRSDAARSPVAASWRRSMEHHGLDPARGKVPHVVEARELARRRDELGEFLAMAMPKLDQLFALVGASGCGVLLTDATGIVLDLRCADADAEIFRGWGLRPGADWSEAHEGTNGIGTCLAERRRVTIHRDDHFLARNTVLSCMDAPIFGADGHILAALDVSSARVNETEGFNRLLSAAVSQYAQTIENLHFRATFPDARIILADPDEADATALLAVDDNDLVIGATRSARRIFGLESVGPLKLRPSVDLFGRGDGPTGFEKAERAAVVRALVRADGNVSQAARVLGIGRATLYRQMHKFGIER